MRKKEKQDEKKEAVETLRKIIKPGDTIRTIITKTSATNLTWYARSFIVEKGRIREITTLIGKACAWSVVYRDGVYELKGCGVGTCRYFEVAHTLSYALHGLRSDTAPRSVRIAEPELRQMYGKNLRDFRAAIEALDKEDRDNGRDPYYRKMPVSAQKYRAGYTIRGESL